MNKKGFIGDFAFYVVFIFMFAIVLITVYMAFSKINDNWQASSDIPDSSKNIMSDSKSKFLATWNWLLVMLVIGLLISIVILAFVLRSHPAFAVLAILALIVVGAVSLYLANAFNVFATSGEIQTYAEEFTLIPLVMNNLPKIVILLGFIFVIVLYAKGGDQSIV